MSVFAELLPGWIGRSRILAAKLAECEKCAQVADSFAKTPPWTSADDLYPPPAEQLAAIATARAIAQRIRERNQKRT